MKPSGSLAKGLAALLRRLSSGATEPLDALWTDPGAILRASGRTPDPWQERFLKGGWSRALLCCSRQTGKSTSLGALTVKTMLTEYPALCLLIGPAERQAKELMKAHVARMFAGLGWPVQAVKMGELEIELANGSRCLVLPDNERTVRGYSEVSLVVIDEASRVSDDLYYSIGPMLAVGQGRLVAGSTPYGKRGWFFEEFGNTHSGENWKRISVPATDCPRIDPGFLKKERERMGERWFNQEYMCGWVDMIDAVFSGDDIDAAMAGADFEPLF